MLERDQLHAYQIRSAEFIKDNPSCALWVDMGLGKTVSTLTALVDLFDRFEIGKVLIIAPLRVAQYTWGDEIKNWEHTRQLTHCVLAGKPAKQRLQAVLYDNSDIHLINRENVKWLVDETRKNWQYDTVIIDESSSFKSPSAQRFKALKKVLPSIDRIVELTGTPASNGLLDIYSQVFLLDCGERLGKTMTAYKSRYFDSDYMGYNFTIREGAEQQIYDKLGDIVLRLDAEDYLKMPARIDNKIEVHLPIKARQQYAELEKEFILELESDTVTALSAASLTGKLLQCANGALYVNDEGGYQTLHDAKLDALDEIVAETSEPILVAYNFKSDLARLKKRYPKAVAIDERNAMKRWNEGKIDMLLAHPASAGHGLNLQKGGSTIVWFGLNWSLELYQQFNGRLHRQGQTKPVVVHHIVAKDTVDETVLTALTEKNITQKALLNALKDDIETREK